MTLQELARSRGIRIGLAVSLIALGAMGFVPYVFNTISTQAEINAPLIRLTAPVDGTVADLPESGKFYIRATSIRLLELSQDTGPVADLKTEAELAAAQIELARRQLAELVGQSQKLKRRAALFSSATSSNLTASAQSQAALLRGCEADRAALDAARERTKILAQQGFMSASGVDKAEAAAASKDNECRSAAARLRAIAIQQQAAGAGVFISDGYNDAPYAEQQADRLVLQRQALEKMLTDATARYTQARLRLTDAMARASFTAPAGTLVWMLTSSEGAAIRAGEPVLDLVDCRRRFVQVALPENQAERLAPGSPARIRMIGSDAWLDGEVVNITGGAGRTEGALLAATAGGDPGERKISVKVALPVVGPEALSAARKCDVGRMAEVRFNRGI